MNLKEPQESVIKSAQLKKWGTSKRLLQTRFLTKMLSAVFRTEKRPVIRYFALRAAGFLTEKVLFLIRATVTVKPRNLSCATILFATIYRKILPLTKILTV